jgi:uncharacterized protein YidB (DUF937 family)
MSLQETFGDGAALMQRVGELIRTDGLQDLLAGLDDAGVVDQVRTWLGSGANEPVEPGAVEKAIGRTRTEAMAGELGVTADQLAAGVARVLPAVVDHLTPDGHLPTGAQLDSMDLSSVDAGALLR